MNRQDLYHSFENFIFKGVLPEIPDRELGKLVQLLRESKLLSSCYFTYAESELWHTMPSFLKKHLSSAKVYSDRQASQVLYEARIINKALKDYNIYPVYLKGASYTLRESDNAHGRVYSDIDVLVKKDQLSEAEEALNKVGWKCKKLDDYDEAYYREWSHEIPPMVNIHRGTVIDLHHNIVLPISGRKPDVSILRHNSIILKNGTEVLSPEATFLHSAVHLIINEDVSSGYRDVFDLVCLIRQYQTEAFWQELLQLANRLNFERVLLIALLLCEKVADIKAPKHIINSLSIHTSFRLANWYATTLLYHALKPNSSFISTKRSRLARMLIFLSGHVQKMPFPILIKHTAHKFYISFVEGLLGKFYLSK